MRAALGEGPIVGDDHPRIEHFAAGLPSEGPGTDQAGQTFLDEILGAQRLPERMNSLQTRRQ